MALYVDFWQSFFCALLCFLCWIPCFVPLPLLYSFFCVFIPIGLCYLPLFPSFFPWLLIALWWFCLLLFHVCPVGAPVWRFVTVQHSPAHCTAQWQKKKPLTKNRGLVIYSHKYSELRELRDSSTQSYSTPTTKQKRPFSTLCVGSPKRTETKCSTWKNP